MINERNGLHTVFFVSTTSVHTINSKIILHSFLSRLFDKILDISCSCKLSYDDLASIPLGDTFK